MTRYWKPVNVNTVVDWVEIKSILTWTCIRLPYILIDNFSGLKFPWHFNFSPPWFLFECCILRSKLWNILQRELFCIQGHISDEEKTIIFCNTGRNTSSNGITGFFLGKFTRIVIYKKYEAFQKSHSWANCDSTFYLKCYSKTPRIRTWIF